MVGLFWKIILLRAQLGAACVATYTYDFPAYNVPTTTSTTTTTTTTTTAGCPGTGWTIFNGYDYCYVTSSPTDPTGAITGCQAIGAQLTSIHSTAENTFIKDMVAGATIWLGGGRILMANGMYCDTVGASSCFYNYDGTPFDYHNWSGINPDNGSGMERCLQMNYGANAPGTWNDVNCNGSHGYVCKKPA